jgi:hypothetical protein
MVCEKPGDGMKKVPVRCYEYCIAFLGKAENSIISGTLFIGSSNVKKYMTLPDKHFRGFFWEIFIKKKIHWCDSW